jgi:hypothetical protein
MGRKEGVISCVSAPSGIFRRQCALSTPRTQPAAGGMMGGDGGRRNTGVHKTSIKQRNDTY